MRVLLISITVAAATGCSPASCDVEVQGEVKPPAPEQPGPNAVVCEGIDGAEPSGEPVSGLDSQQVEQAIEPMLRGLAACVTDRDSGKLALRVTAAHEGSPRFVEPIGDHAGARLGACAARTLCEMSLPPLAREISFGYNLQVSELQILKDELAAE